VGRLSNFNGPARRDVGKKVLLVDLFYFIVWCIICGVETVRNEQSSLNLHIKVKEVRCFPNLIFHGQFCKPLLGLEKRPINE